MTGYGGWQAFRGNSVKKSLTTILAGFLLAFQSPDFYSLAVSAEPPGRVHSRSGLGDIIEDGNGYGGVRIGSTEAALLAQWGSPGQVTQSGSEKTYLYSLGSDEIVAAFIKDSQVEMILFMLRRPTESSLTTVRGVKLGSPFEEVRRLYGNPEFQDGREASYPSRGISFKHEAGIVAYITIFLPGTTIERRK